MNTNSEKMSLVLAENILTSLRDAGATLEQALAAIKIVEAVLPIAGLRSFRDSVLRIR